MALEDAFSLYDGGDFSGAKQIFREHLEKESAIGSLRERCQFNLACCLASQGSITEALIVFASLPSKDNDVIYNRALCEYHQRFYGNTIKLTNQILKNILDSHPEYSNDGVNLMIRSDIHESSVKRDEFQSSLLIETLNLQSAAIFKEEENLKPAIDCLNQLNITNKADLDCVLLHNFAIYGATSDQEESIDKLLFLAKKQLRDGDKQVPKETVQNLSAIYLAVGRLEELKNFMEEFKSQIASTMESEMFQYIKLLVGKGHRPVEISKDLKSAVERLTDKLRKLDPKLEVTKHNRAADLLRLVFSHCASIWWYQYQYKAIERLSNRVRGVLGEGDSLSLKILANSIFMQENRYDEAITLLERYLADSPSLLSVDPYPLGNLCVSYVLTGRYSDAEALIKDIEAEESQTMAELDPLLLQRSLAEDLKIEMPKHTSIINVIIGTLYCLKYNIEFGFARLAKSVDPVERKPDSELWPYIKRCILYILDSHCKQKIWLSDDVFEQIIDFLIECESNGTNVDAYPTELISHKCTTISFEARYLRSIALSIIHD